MAQRKEIASRARELEATPARPQDFTTGQTSDFSLARFLQSEEREWSLYSVDRKSRHVVFVETGREADIYEAPFLYAAQFEAAEAVVWVSFDELRELAESLPSADECVLFVQSVGRSGSTLAGRVLGACEGVGMISEPDVLLEVMSHRPRPSASGPALDQAGFEQLLESVVRVLVYQRLLGQELERAVIKPRSQVTELMPELSRLYPRAPTVFLGRRPVPWIKSVFSALLRDVPIEDDELLRSFENGFAAWLPAIERAIVAERPMSMAKMWALNYASAMGRLDEATAGPGAPRVVQFEELKEQPRRVFGALVDELGLKLEEAELERVLAEDSQKGSGFSQTGVGRDSFVLDQRHIDEAIEVWREWGIEVH